MAMNLTKTKKWGAFFLAGILPGLALMFMLMQSEIVVDAETQAMHLNFNPLMVLLPFVGVVFLCIAIGSKMISHPLTQMIEGDGMLVFDVSSTGIIAPFIVKLNGNMIQGKLNKRPVESFFSRDLVARLIKPRHASAIEQEDKVIIELPKKDEHKYTFGMGSWTCLLYNSQLGTFMSKETLALVEERVFVNHLVLYLNKKIEELSEKIRDFARYIVEHTRPRKGILDNPLIWIVILIVLGLILLAMAPIAINFLTNLGVLPAPVAPTGTELVPGQAITPSNLGGIPTR